MTDTASASPATPTSTTTSGDSAEYELANRLFFRLYQCANILHKTGTRAVESEGLTTQRWAVMGALSRPESADGMAVGELAGYLRVSRQSLAGVIGPLIDDGLVDVRRSDADGRVRNFVLTAHGVTVWRDRARPKIERFYADATAGIDDDEIGRTVEQLGRLIENMSRLDETS